MAAMKPVGRRPGRSTKAAASTGSLSDLVAQLQSIERFQEGLRQRLRELAAQRATLTPQPVTEAAQKTSAKKVEDPLLKPGHKAGRGGQGKQDGAARPSRKAA